MTIKQLLIKRLREVLGDLGVTDITPEVSYPSDPKFGDYATNVAMVAIKKNKELSLRQAQTLSSSKGIKNQGIKTPMEFAEEIISKFKIQSSKFKWIEKMEIAGPGFINFWIDNTYFIQQINDFITNNERLILQTSLSEKRIIVEYGHPNTHKEMHIGHMRTLITGEALARLLEAAGATVFRANYQGDIGLHVAKALYGIREIMDEKKLTLKDLETWNDAEKAHFLGEGYVRGNQDYKEHNEEIDNVNKLLYQGDPSILPLYQTTRQWSLDYYNDFYKRFYSKYDRLFFESEIAALGKKIVGEQLGKIFTTDNGAVVFHGEKYGLHTRVFITQNGTPTYEAKEMALAQKQYEAFAFDKNIHVVANEQAGYFQVVFKALEKIDPKKFGNSEYHLSMGMVQLTDRKMSSRTGDILTVDWLLDEVKNKVEELMAEGRISASDKDGVAEQITIGAVKYSVLKSGTGQNVAFDINTSVSLDGNSGPYIQYTFARTQSVLRKAKISNFSSKGGSALGGQSHISNFKLTYEEREVLRLLNQFPEQVGEAAERFAPNILCTYLFELAQAFNLFYQKLPILKAPDSERELRLILTAATGKVLQEGLKLLGIQSPEKM